MNSSSLAPSQWKHAAKWQQDRLPSRGPLLDGWQVAGWAEQACAVGGHYYDWFLQSNSHLTVAVGSGHGSPLEAALAAAALQTAVRTCGQLAMSPTELASRMNATFWTGSTGGQFASLAYAVIAPDSGEVEWIAAGEVRVWLVGAERATEMPGTPCQLGAAEEAPFSLKSAVLQPDAALLIVTKSVCVANELQTHYRDSAAALASRLRRQGQSNGSGALDGAALVVKRAACSRPPCVNG